MTSTTPPGPVAIVSHTLPPAPNGQAIVLGRLLEGLDHHDVLLLTSMNLEAKVVPRALRAATVPLPPEPRVSTRVWGLRTAAALTDMVVRGSSRADAIRRLAGQHGARAIVCCTGEVFEMVACAHAARSLGLPFHVVMFDWYAHKFRSMPGLQGRIASAFAGWAEPHLLADAAAVVVTNEVMAEELARRDGLRPVVIRLPADPDLLRGDADEASASRPWPRVPPRVEIVFCGSIYHAHHGALVNLLAAIRELAPLDIGLVLYSSADPKDLAAAGIEGPFELRPWASLEEIRTAMKAADVLFLPFAFDAPFPQIVRTATPTKLPDYLASGRPLLAHVPADTFVARYLRQHECGLLVDRDDPAALAAALRRLIEEPELRARLARNARARSRADFDADDARRAFQGLFWPGREPTRPPAPAAAPWPRVSVVIPAFNRAAWLRAAVDSALAQDYDDFEVIVVDDGSTEDLAAVLPLADSRVRLLRQEHAGAAAARNAGLAVATGKYVALLDSDDLFRPGKLRRQVALMEENPDAAMSHTSYLRMAASGEWLEVVSSGRQSGWVYAELARKCTIATPTVMLRREAIAAMRFDEGRRVAEDLLFWIAVARTSRVLGIDEPLSGVRMHGANAALDPASQIEASEVMVDRVLGPDRLLGPLRRRQLMARHLVALARLHLNRDEWRRAARAGWRALAAWPPLALRVPRRVALELRKRVGRLLPRRLRRAARSQWSRGPW
ncbi:MAG: glycosyltransferase [Vicinamibacteria bacterium]|nr:glycosyltransferase [Vicinamibacteria bacterium]